MKMKITKFKVFSGLAIVVMAVVSIYTYVLAVAPAMVTDNFDDSSKIASSTSVAVASGVVALSAASSWTCGSSLVDSRDAQTYATILIGTQCWMAANLNIGIKITSCTNGYAGVCTTGGDTVKNQGTACALSDGSDIQKYCYSDTAGNCTTYGGLYQWNQAMCGSPTEGVQGICPTGWHIPTDAEQYTLENYLKGVGQTCDANRSGTYDCSPAGSHLSNYTLNHDNSSGFSALLAGYRDAGGSFNYLTSATFFWSSLQSSSSSAWSRYLYSGNATVGRGTNDKADGFSVRCLKN